MTAPTNRIARLEEPSPILRELLEAFHEWMHDHESSYDPEEELQVDLETLSGQESSWAWLAETDEGSSGCVLLVGHTPSFAECRRLWVRPTVRGSGLGRELMEAAIAHAWATDFESIGLTMPPWSEAATVLYESLGFVRTPPYPETDLPERFYDDAIFMQLQRGNGPHHESV